MRVSIYQEAGKDKRKHQLLSFIFDVTNFDKKKDNLKY